MHTDPAEQLRSRIVLLQQRRKAIAGAVWAVAGLVIVFSLGTGTSLLIDHGVWWGIAWMPSVAADVALIVSLLGDQVLADSEIERTPRWGKVLRYVAALVTLGLNTTAAITGPTIDPHAATEVAAVAAAAARAAVGRGPDWVSVGIHASIVLVLIAATEAAQAYVRSFTPELVRLRTELADLAAARRAQERAEDEARQVRQAEAHRAAVEAQRAAAEAAERASAAERDRASAEAELVRQRASAEAELVRQRAAAEAAERASAAALARASAEADRVRQEERERRSQARRAAPPAPVRMRQEDVTAAALRHAEQRGELPSESELVSLTGTSRATAGRALRAARQTHEQTHSEQTQTEETQSLRLVQTSP